MNITLKSEVLDQLTARGMLAYIALKLNGGKYSSPAKLAALVRVKEDVMADCMKHIEGVDLMLESKPKAKKKPVAFTLPRWVDRDVWDKFVATRKALGKPLTEYACDLLVKKLESLEKAGNPHVEVLQQSIVNNWQGIFPIKQDSAQTAYGMQSAPTKLRATEFKL